MWPICGASANPASLVAGTVRTPLGTVTVGAENVVGEVVSFLSLTVNLGNKVYFEEVSSNLKVGVYKEVRRGFNLIVRVKMLFGRPLCCASLGKKWGWPLKV